MVVFASSAKSIVVGAALAVSFGSDGTVARLEVSLMVPDTNDAERESVVRSIPDMDDLDLIAIDPPQEWIDEDWNEYA